MHNTALVITPLLYGIQSTVARASLPCCSGPLLAPGARKSAIARLHHQSMNVQRKSLSSMLMKSHMCPDRLHRVHFLQA